jgi:hypothetical protein
MAGEEWQQWANLLLERHYGPTEYQKVPDNQQGDAGIEGFTISDGHAYQAYGCEEPLSTADRYAKQRNKMTEDIKKFINNRTTLARIFCNVMITRWSLFVPYYDSKELVAHAATKTQEVLAAALPYVGRGFRVMVCDEECFSVERDALLTATNRTVPVSAAPIPPEQIDEWTNSHDTLIATLDQKIRKLPTIATEAERHEFRHQLLKWHLEGQEVLSNLRKYPEAYENVIRAKAHRENYLATTTLLSGGSPGQIFTTALQTLFDTVQQEAKQVSRTAAEALAHEAVADWMMRCPLDFPTNSHE